MNKIRNTFLIVILTLAIIASIFSFFHSFVYYQMVMDELSNSTRYKVYTVDQYLREGPSSDYVNVILRHDVDFKISNTQFFKEMEKKNDIRSTFYFRTRGPYNILQYGELLYNLTLEKWEVGLHYEEPYVDKWNWSKAVEDFGKDLSLMHSFTTIKTVCPHGNEANQKYPNSDIFNFTTYAEWGLNGDASLSFRGKAVSFYSDSNNAILLWIQILQSAKKGQTIYFLIHPDWWRSWPW